jgi:hypothetical protein
MKYDNAIRAILSLICVAGFAALLWDQRALKGQNDFMQLYVGAMEAGGAGLYDPENSYRFQRETFSAVADSIIFVRPPFYALLLKPLTWLGSYDRAHAAFTVLRLASLVWFILLWPKKGRGDALMFLFMSLPVFIGMMNGQDAILMLPLMALALRKEEEGKGLQAGLALSLCAIKPHLLVLLPIALIAQRRWDVLKGGALGGVILFSVSFLAGGWGWIASFVHVLRLGVIHPEPEVMPTLKGLLNGSPHLTTLTTIGTLGAVIALIAIARRGNFVAGFAAATVGSILVAGHAYVSDMAILLPGLLAMAQTETRPAGSHLAAFIWLGPVLPLLLLLGRPISYIPQILLPLTLLALALAVKGGSVETEPQLELAGSQ